ncbi:MAG: excinuclease ABC subunit UvrA [Bacteroidota bacterium]
MKARSSSESPRKRGKDPPGARSIVIRGARVHNLKNVSLELPHNRLIVVTGVSGSGKSSLAFDTIYAEGQRRYVESLSSYARQFLERMDRPEVDSLQGIRPAMAIEQKTGIRNPRSTVATATEVYDYLRLLFARAGRTYCTACGRPVVRDSVATVCAALMERLHRMGREEEGVLVTFPLPSHPGERLEESLANLRKEGFFRVVRGGTVLDLEREALPPEVQAGEIHVLVDRLVFRAGMEDARFADSVETAFASGAGQMHIRPAEGGAILGFNRNFLCGTCGITYEEPDPRMFSFNSPFGACPECQGFGKAVGVDMDLVVPDPGRSIREGAVAAWETPKFAPYRASLLGIAAEAGVRPDVPFRDLTPGERSVIMEGHGPFPGLKGFFRFLEKKSYKVYYRVLLSRYRGYTTCPACSGSRLRPTALQVRVGGRSIHDVVRMTIKEAAEFIRGLDLAEAEREIARRVLAELERRLGYLDEAGIGYLTLDRLSSTLSGGESQRINLAASLGSSLMSALYVLDEPSVGLHPRDNDRLIRILKALRDGGNTVLVVEHDAAMMRQADVLVDLGPGAGEQGGEVVYCGPPGEIPADGESLTGRYLAGGMKIPVPRMRRAGSGRVIGIEGAAANNLRNLSLTIPLNMFVCVTGVSGSGKSSLVHEVLYAGLRRVQGKGGEAPPGRGRITGAGQVSGVELVDQSPIGRSPRSNPITYVGAFDAVRALFAGTQAARVRGFTPGHFSFNVPGGRCEACEGAGSVLVEMQFLADLLLPCEACKGKRYREEVLQVQYRGKNIHDILRATVDEAVSFLSADPAGRKAAARLKVLQDVGLGYIRTGQSATTLSGGEAQRVKLATHLADARRGEHTLFLLDEPTTGLHPADIARLLACFDALLEAGHSIVVIEHNLDVIKCADLVLDLGPEAGAEGGRIVAVGTPEEVARCSSSHTGRYLRPLLEEGTAPGEGAASPR